MPALTPPLSAAFDAAAQRARTAPMLISSMPPPFSLILPPGDVLRLRLPAMLMLPRFLRRERCRRRYAAIAIFDCRFRHAITSDDASG